MFPRKMLENDATVRAWTDNFLAVDQNGASFHRQKAADQVKQRRLAATGRPEQSDKFTVGDME